MTQLSDLLKRSTSVYYIICSECRENSDYDLNNISKQFCQGCKRNTIFCVRRDLKKYGRNSKINKILNNG